MIFPIDFIVMMSRLRVRLAAEQTGDTSKTCAARFRELDSASLNTLCQTRSYFRFLMIPSLPRKLQGSSEYYRAKRNYPATDKALSLLLFSCALHYSTMV